MQNYFTLYTLFIKGDTKFWLVVLDKYKKLQPRHKGLTLILKYKSALLCCISLRCEYQIPKKFCFPFHRKIDKFLVNKPSASLISVPLSPAPPWCWTLKCRPTKSRVGHRQTYEQQSLFPTPLLPTSTQLDPDTNVSATLGSTWSHFSCPFAPTAQPRSISTCCSRQGSGCPQRAVTWGPRSHPGHHSLKWELPNAKTTSESLTPTDCSRGFLNASA